MTRRDLVQRLGRQPFSPFRVRCSDGTSIDVIQSTMLIVGETSAVLPTAWSAIAHDQQVAKRWRTVPFDLMIQLVDVD